jgi:hypothetical protein
MTIEIRKNENLSDYGADRVFTSDKEKEYSLHYIESNTFAIRCLKKGDNIFRTVFMGSTKALNVTVTE